MPNTALAVLAVACMAAVTSAVLIGMCTPAPTLHGWCLSGRSTFLRDNGIPETFKIVHVPTFLQATSNILAFLVAILSFLPMRVLTLSTPTQKSCPRPSPRTKTAKA